ncbi:hypothetical protein Tco_0410880 [Tanacetum coccineum]
MSAMAEHVIAAQANNRPPMLDKSKYKSWQSHMLLYIKGKKHGKQLYDLVINGPFQYGAIEVPATPTTLASIRDRTYEDLTKVEKIREACDIRSTNIVLQILPPDVYRLVVPLFLPSNDLIVSLNKAIAFISTSFASRYPPTNNQLRTSSNLRNQATIQDGSVVNRNMGTNTATQAKVIRCYNCQGEGTYGILENDGERIPTDQDTQELTTTAIFQTNDLNAFDSDCDEAPASAVLMAKLSAYDSYILLEVPNLDTYQNNTVIDKSVQEMQYSKQPPFINDSDIDITSDSNVIFYDQYLKESEIKVVQDITSSAQQDAMIMSVIDEISNLVAKYNERGNILCIAMHADLDNKYVMPANDDNLAYAKMEQSSIDEYNRCLKLKAELSKKNDMVEKAVYTELLKRSSRLKQHSRSLQPLDSALDYACKFTTRIQELLVYLSSTCPSSLNKNKKLVTVTPMNKTRKVWFEEPSTSSSNTPKQVDSQNTQTTNKPLLTSIGVNGSTHASGSKPKGNTRNNKITRPSSSNQKE